MRSFQFITAFLLGLVLISCGADRGATLDLSKTYRVRLEDENITMEVPNRYQRTSIETMAYDISNYFEAVQDTQAIIKQLTMEQFADEKLDIFYDTISKFSFFIVRNTSYVPLNRQFAQTISPQINQRIMNQNLGFGEKIEKMTNSYNENDDTAVLRMKYKVYNQFNPDIAYYYTTYACSMSGGFGAVVSEISLGQFDIYPVIWSIR